MHNEHELTGKDLYSIELNVTCRSIVHTGSSSSLSLVSPDQTYEISENSRVPVTYNHMTQCKYQC